MKTVSEYVRQLKQNEYTINTVLAMSTDDLSVKVQEKQTWTFKCNEGKLATSQNNGSNGETSDRMQNYIRKQSIIKKTMTSHRTL